MVMEAMAVMMELVKMEMEEMGLEKELMVL